MTFDEIVYGLSGNDSNEKMTVSETIRLIEILRQEYAPTIEMTKEQHDYIAPLIKEGKELGATFTEIWEVYKFIGASKKIDRTFDSQEQAMQAWLHPETIKIVDE
ncbi:hypothetical protein [Leuconostoc mesenteroides]|uniref:hypothetical protein n=1 Tax=Leuconostoc mesenteroides TaxID=1245 RepID=UPI0021A693B9|nr:hypothetical protein [Leuconostoc mesenteroides]MCT3048251.1 hypothetical protein [Leuconostoc mesenteroides]